MSEAEYNGGSNQPFTVILASPDLSNIIKTTTAELFPMPYHGKEK